MKLTPEMMEKINQITESWLGNVPIEKDAKLKDRDRAYFRVGFFEGMKFMEEYLKPGH